MILILGENGYISKRFQDFFKFKKVDYKAVSLKNCNSQFDVYDLIEEFSPDYVINATGYTGNPNIDECETNKEECLYVNSILPEIISEACKFFKIPLGHLSSGCIYQTADFNYHYQYKESQIPNFSFSNRNCSWYSGTKVLGESLVRKTWEESYIWRLRMPFNHLDSSKNLLSKFLKFPKVWNYKNSVTNLDEFVQICYYCFIKNVPYGTYNIVNPNPINAKEILEIAKKLNLTDKNYEYLEDLDEFNKLVKSPRSNCNLSSDKIQNEGFGLLDMKDSVYKCFANWNNSDKNPFW